MDMPTSTPDSTEGSTPSITPDPAELRWQGAIGGRWVVNQTNERQRSSLRERLDAIRVAIGKGARKILRQRSMAVDGTGSRAPSATGMTSTAADGARSHRPASGVRPPHLPFAVDAGSRAFAPDLELDPQVPAFQQMPPRLLTAPVLPGVSRVVVETRVVSGKTLGARFPDGYTMRWFVPDQHCVARYEHLHNLEQVIFQHTGGRELFAGLRHDLIRVRGLEPARLRRLPDEILLRCAGGLNYLDAEVRHFNQFPDWSTGYICRCLQDPTMDSMPVSLHPQRMASESMAREAATAALVADDGKWMRALAGETVNVDLFSIALLAPDDLRLWPGQHRALDALARGPRCFPRQNRASIALVVRDRQGDKRTILAEVAVRQFVLSAAEKGFRMVRPTTHPHRGQPDPLQPCIDVLRLLGPEGPSELGGDIKVRVDAMRSQVLKLRREFREVDREYCFSTGNLGALHPRTRELEASLDGLQYQLNCLRKDCRSLVQAGEQLRAMYAAENDWPAGVEASREAAARLSLVAYLMGETPLVSCAKGKDFAEELFAEVKLLAAGAENRDGELSQ